MKLIDQYNRDGYVIVRNVLDAALIKEASDHVEWLMKKNPGRRPEQLWQDLIPNDPFWVRLVGDGRLLDVAQQFIGPNIALFASHYLCKPAGNGLPVLWHQDGSYWPLAPMEVTTLWLAVDDSTPENGCMRVIPGTQHLKLQQLKERKDVSNVLNSEIDASFVDESKAATSPPRHGSPSRGAAISCCAARPCPASTTTSPIPATSEVTRRWLFVAASNGNSLDQFKPGIFTANLHLSSLISGEQISVRSVP